MRLGLVVRKLFPDSYAQLSSISQTHKDLAFSRWNDDNFKDDDLLSFVQYKALDSST